MDPSSNMDQEQAFRDARIATSREVRRGIVRISFDWKKNDVVIIAGMVIAKYGNSYEVIANNIFLKQSRKNGKENFAVRFPIPDSYGQEMKINVNSSGVRDIGNDFMTFDITPNESEAHIVRAYVDPVTFEIGPIAREAYVDAFIFPREKFISPTIYSPGSIIDSTLANQPTLGFSFNDCSGHEFAHFGSPIFNHRGHLVGVMFGSQARIHAWSVSFLSQTVLKQMRPNYCRGGQIIQPDPAA